MLNVATFRRRLQEKEQELLSLMAKHESAARDSSVPEAGDRMDRVVSLEGAEEEFQFAGSEWQVLEQVREALQRIDIGTYGICIDCGKQIDPARLEAIPWTPYCADDQNRHDRGPTGEMPHPPTL